MCKKEVLGHHIPLHAWQVSSVELQESPGKQVAKVSQSCQQHIPAGCVVVVVVVAGAHFSSQPATQTENTAGLVGQSPMQALNAAPVSTAQAALQAAMEPPGH